MAPEESTDVEQQELGAVKSVYEVPVSDPALESQATHPVSVKVKRDLGTIRVHYDLPVELVGAPDVAVDLTGVDTGMWVKVAGDAGLGTCVVTSASIVCREHLPGVVVNLEGVRAKAVLDGLPPAEVEKRVAIAKQFMIDPIGIMRGDMRAQRVRENERGR